MTVDIICASLWAFCGGINCAKAISTGHWSDWVIMGLDLLCAGTWITVAHLKNRNK